MNALHSIHADHRESSDRYRGEIYRAGKWRVITCRDSVQWILQTQTRADSPDGARWEARSYCRTRKALVRLWTAATGEDSGALVALLPEFFRT